MTKELIAGDFTGLADDYSRNRPDYCPSVLSALLGLQGKSISEIDQQLYNKYGLSKEEIDFIEEKVQTMN